MSTLQAPQIVRKCQTLWLVLLLRSVLFLAELGLGLWSHSLSLLAGSGHLLADLVTLGLTLLVASLTQYQPIAQIPLKYQRLEAWVALLNGASLGAIALWLSWGGVKDLQAPDPVLGLPMLTGSALSLVINGLSIYLLYEDSHHNLNVQGILLHGVADVASSISIVIAALAVYWFNWVWADAVGGLLVALLIALSAGLLSKESLRRLRHLSPRETKV